MDAGKVRELKLVISAYDKGLKTGLREARSELKGFNTSTKTANSSMKKMSSTVGITAANIIKLAAAYGAFRAARSAVVTIADFNTKMAEVSTMTDVTTAGLQNVSREIINISTRIPQSAAQLAAAEYDILSAGVALKDSTKVLEISAKAAIAGVTDTKTAVNAGVGVMNAYGQGVDELSGIYDTLFQTVKLGVIRFEELSQNIGKVLPIARQAGVDFQTVAGAIASLTKSGIKADIATVALRGAITALSTPTAEARQKMNELGISWNGLEGTLKQIADKNLGPEVMRQIIPDVRARTAVSSLTQNFDQLHETLDRMTDSAGSMEEASQKMLDTVGNQFTLLKNRIAAGILSNNDFRDTLQNVTEHSKETADAIGILASKILSLTSTTLKGWGALISFADAHFQYQKALFDVMDAQDKFKPRLDAVNQATGLSIKTSKELVSLVEMGVVSYDKQTKALKINAISLDLYKKGLLKAGVAGKDFVNVADHLAETTQKAKPPTDELAASGTKQAEVMDKQTLSAEKLKEALKGVSEQSSIANAAYKLSQKELELSLAQGKITEDEFRQQRLQAEKQHWVKMIDLRRSSIKAMADAGKEGSKEYMESLAKLRDAETHVINIDKELAKSTAKTGDAMLKAGSKGKEGAKTAEAAWQFLADRVGMTVDELKAALSGITSEIEKTKKSLSSGSSASYSARDEEGNRKSRTVTRKFDSMNYESLKGSYEVILRKLEAGYGSGVEIEAIKTIAENMAKLQGLTKEQTEILKKQMLEDAKNRTRLTQNRHVDYMRMMGYASGGHISGIGDRDSVPAMLTPGEYVMRKSIVSRMGRGFFDALNAGSSRWPTIRLPKLPVQRFATGGPVDPSQTITLDFRLGGQSHQGVFAPDVAEELISSLKQASMVSA